MDKYQWYFEQLVSETHLDNAFDWVEAAMWKTRASALLARTAGSAHGAIHVGADVVQNAAPNLNVIVETGACTDPTGRNVEWSSDQTVDCSVDYLGSSTAVGTPGNERYLGVFAFWDQDATDTVIDGNGLEVQSKINESFLIRVYAGTEAGAGSANPPATPADSIRLANVLLAYGATSILNADIEYDTTNYLRDDYIRVAGVNLADFVFGNPSDAIEQLFSDVDSLVVGTGITFSGTQDWHDASGVLSSTDVSGAINEILEDLAADTGGAWGSDKIGSEEYSTTYGNADLTRGSVSDQIREAADTLDTFVNGFDSNVDTHILGICLSNWERLLNDASSGIDLDFVEYHPVVGKWVFLDSGPNVFTSSDGLELSAAPAHTLSNWGIAISYDLTRYLVGTTTGDIEYCTDPDSSWSTELETTIGGAGTLRCIETKYPSSNFTMIARGVANIRIGALGIGGGWVAPTTSPPVTTATRPGALCYLGGSNWVLLTWNGSYNNGHTFKSTDDGDNWYATATMPSDVVSGMKLGMDYNQNTGRLIVVGEDLSSDGSVLYSDDVGDNWSVATLNYKPAYTGASQPPELNEVKYISGNTWIAVGNEGGIGIYHLLISHDDGENWNQVIVNRQDVSEVAKSLNGIATDGTKVICSGDDGRAIGSLSHVGV